MSGMREVADLGQEHANVRLQETVPKTALGRSRFAALVHLANGVTRPQSGAHFAF